MKYNSRKDGKMDRYISFIIIFLSAIITPAYSQRYFEFGSHDIPQGENFVAATSDSMQIALAGSQLLLPDTLRGLHIHGFLMHGNPGYNLNWHWYFQPNTWRLVEASVELCDARPSSMERDTSFWTDGWPYCPWHSYVLREIYPMFVEEEMVNEQSVAIYPNPTRGIFSIGIPTASTKYRHLQVFNILGQTVLTQSIPISQFSAHWQVDISKLPDGIYYLRVFFGNETVVRKLIKQ